MNTIKGRVIVLGDDVDTDQILPGYAMAEPMDQLGNFAMAGLAGLDFKSVFQPGDIIVAGRNFGCGSSREQAPIALKQVGVALVIAKGFARIFRRNSINIGMPVWAVSYTHLDVYKRQLQGCRFRAHPLRLLRGPCARCPQG